MYNDIANRAIFFNWSENLKRVKNKYNPSCIKTATKTSNEKYLFKFVLLGPFCLFRLQSTYNKASCAGKIVLRFIFNFDISLQYFSRYFIINMAERTVWLLLEYISFIRLHIYLAITRYFEVFITFRHIAIYMRYILQKLTVKYVGYENMKTYRY